VALPTTSSFCHSSNNSDTAFLSKSIFNNAHYGMATSGPRVPFATA
jgi:hypothetical protein